MTDRTAVVSLSCYAGFNEADEAIAELVKYGVTFESVIRPTGVVESWRFYGCQNVPTVLPHGWATWKDEPLGAPSAAGSPVDGR